MNRRLREFVDKNLNLIGNDSASESHVLGVTTNKNTQQLDKLRQAAPDYYGTRYSMAYPGFPATYNTTSPTDDYETFGKELEKEENGEDGEYDEYDENVDDEFELNVNESKIFEFVDDLINKRSVKDEEFVLNNALPNLNELKNENPILVKKTYDFLNTINTLKPSESDLAILLNEILKRTPASKLSKEYKISLIKTLNNNQNSL